MKTKTGIVLAIIACICTMFICQIGVTLFDTFISMSIFRIIQLVSVYSCVGAIVLSVIYAKKY